MSSSAFSGNVQGLATASSPGLVGTGSQTFAGIKTFQDGLVPATPMMFRNKIINGGFDIWQRATSSTGTTGYVSADRWRVEVGNTNTTRNTFTLGQTAVSGNPKYYMTVTKTVAASSSNAFLIQRMEFPEQYSGQTLTVSFWAKAASSKSFQCNFFGVMNGVTVVDSTTFQFNATTSWQKFTGNIVLSNFASGATSTVDDFLAFRFIEADSFSTFTLDIAQVQVELGSAATPFESRPLSQELLLAFRYYWTPAYNTTETDFPRIRSSLNSGTAVQFDVVTPVVLRKKPTLTGAHTTDYRIFAAGGGAGVTISSASVIKYNNNHVTVEVIATSGAGDAVLAFNVAGSGLCGFNSEL